MKIRRSSLPLVVDHVRLRSLEGSLYTLEVLIDGSWYVLVDDGDQVLRFRSAEAARRQFEHLRARKATLLHCSAFQEMIGLPEGGTSGLEVSIAWGL